MDRETRYLSLVYGVSTAMIQKCIKMVADPLSADLNDVRDIIYDIDSKIVKVCDGTDIGLRSSIEDTHLFTHIEVEKLGGVVTIAGVFDGHGGPEVSEILKLEIGPFLEAKLNENLGDVENVLVDAIIEFDESLRDRNVESGSTLTMVLITKNEIYTINLGDSRTIVFTTSGDILLETVDHKPSDPSEQTRIEDAGGTVVKILGVKRVNENLSLSRAIGDFSDMDKPLNLPYPISNRPDILYLKRDQPVYIILACDGVWDVMTSKEISSMITKNRGPDSCKNIIETSLYKGGTDNLTVMLLKA